MKIPSSTVNSDSMTAGMSTPEKQKDSSQGQEAEGGGNDADDPAASTDRQALSNEDETHNFNTDDLKEEIE